MLAVTNVRYSWNLSAAPHLGRASGIGAIEPAHSREPNAYCCPLRDLRWHAANQGVHAGSSHSGPHERVPDFAPSGSLAHLFFREVALAFAPYPP